MKYNFSKEAQIFSSLLVEVSIQDIFDALKTSNKKKEIYRAAQDLQEQMRDKFHPAATIQWFDFDLDQKTGIGRIRKESGEAVHFDLGYSGTFLEAATHVIVSVYSIGDKLDKKSTKASARGDHLEAYIIDLIGLIALEKTSDFIKKMAEDQARKMGWGVGPFLSPGSVHGWALEEQTKLCNLLPIDKINVTLKNNTTLYPLKTISSLIGIGALYKTDKVGSTCDVCCKKDSCQMSRTI